MRKLISLLVVFIIILALGKPFTTHADPPCQNADSGDNYTAVNTSPCTGDMVGADSNQAYSFTNSSTVDSQIFGGQADGSGSATNLIDNQVGGDVPNQIHGGEAIDDATNVNTIINAGSTGEIHGGDADYASSGSAMNINNITNTGNINEIHGGDAFSNSTVINNVTNIDGPDSYINFLTSGVPFDNGTDINNFTVNGLITSLDGGRSAGGTLDNNFVVNGRVDYNINGGYSDVGGGAVTNHIVLNGSTTNVYGGDSNGGGVVTNQLVINGTVDADVIGGGNYGGVAVYNTVTLEDGASVGNVIDGNINGTHNVLEFAFSTHSEGAYDQFLKDYAAAHPSGGTITFNGRTYTWENFDELRDLVTFILDITWFNPGDGRVDPRPGDHLAFYCNLNKGTVGAYIVNGDSRGQALTTFSITDLRKAGKTGLSANVGDYGILSLMVDGQNNFWGALNGGTEHANGQGDDAKGFHCDFK